jgi:hypothetical protein
LAIVEPVFANIRIHKHLDCQVPILYTNDK